MAPSQLSPLRLPSSSLLATTPPPAQKVRGENTGSSASRASARDVAIERNVSFRRLLVPVDGTPFGERALPLAASIAKRAGAELRLVHVDSPRESAYYPDLARYYGTDRRRRAYLDRLSRNVAEAAGVEVLGECLVRQDVAEGICEAASRDVDLVIAATHRYGWLASAWYGATFPRLLGRLSTPMLVVPADCQQAALADRWLRKMLISLDGSGQADYVMTTATKLGSLYDANYSLLRVVRNEGTDAARQGLRRVALHLDQHTPCYVVETDAPAADVLASHADDHLMDCIVLTNGNRSKSRTLLRSSVTRALVRTSPVPVLVVPEKTDEAAPGQADR